MWEWLADNLRQLARSPSRAFLVFVAAFLAGVAAHSIYERPVVGVAVIASAATGAVVFSLAARFDQRVVFVCAAVALAALGFWRYDAAWRGSAYALPPAEVSGERFEGSIVSYVRERERDTLLTVETEYGLARLYVRTPLSYIYGDRIAWECSPRSVSAEDGGWNDRLLLDGVRWTCSVYNNPTLLSRLADRRAAPHPSPPPGVRGEGEYVSPLSAPAGNWEYVSSSPAPAVSGESFSRASVFAWLYSLKRGVVRSAQRVLPEPEASFLLGLLIGVKDGLPEDLTDAFRDTGTTHILAVSGYNVTQLISVGVLLLALILIPRRKSAAVMAGGVIMFACVVGGDASVIRAAIMGCVGILATLYGRRYSGVRALLAAAAVMLAVNPLVLRHDVGFQLSFVAVWGLHALAPGLLGLFSPRHRSGLIRVLCETGSATLATMPIVLHSFGRLPAVGLLANLLILPLIPWAMLFGAVATTIGLVSLSVAFVPALIAAWIMRAVEFVALTCAQYVPLALEVQIGSVTVVMLYFWLLLLAVALKKRQGYG